MSDLSLAAIQSALLQNWEQAVEINTEILETAPSDIEAMCRLAYAYSQIGEAEKAKKLYRKVLSQDKYHAIAKKNYDRLDIATKTKSVSYPSQKITITPQLFLEEPGKTKSVVLRNVAPVNQIAHLRIGELVILYPKNHSVEVRDQKKKYLGALPDDIAFRLIRFLKAGNDYHVYIKNVHKNSISVFIREIKRSKKVMMSTFALMNMNIDTTATRKFQKQEKSQVESDESSEEE